MPLVATCTNTNPVSFHISMCCYLTVFTSENLQVLQSDAFCFQQPLDEILSRIDFRKILFSVGYWLLNSVICDFWKSIRKQIFNTSLNGVVHYFLYRVYIALLMQGDITDKAAISGAFMFLHIRGGFNI